MYIELLKHYAANIDSSKIQPAVAKSAIHEAELKLNILFPNELMELLCETNGDNYFLLPLEFIIKDNLDFRSMNPEIIENELFDFSKFLFFATNDQPYLCFLPRRIYCASCCRRYCRINQAILSRSNIRNMVYDFDLCFRLNVFNGI